MTNEIRLSGVVGKDFDADSVAEQLKNMTGDITINLSSPGGSFFVGAEIFNELRRYRGKKTVKMGSLVASAASYIACAGDEVIASDNSSYMIHEVSSAAEGTVGEIRRQADLVEKLNGFICKRLAERSKKSESEIRALMAAETWYYGQEIVDAGFADRLEATGQATERTAAVAQARQTFKIAAMAFRPATIAEARKPLGPVVIDFGDAEESMIPTESAEDLLTIPKNKSYTDDGVVEY